MSTTATSQKRNPKKSAFSCEACRKRKVKCDAGHPVCNRCKIRGDTCVYKLSPTLSYTQRLEQQVADLQAALGRINTNGGTPPSNVSEADTQSPETEQQRAGPSRTIEDLRVEEDGRVSFHGSTSLFQLPGSIRTRAVEQALAEQELVSKRESLVNNAWRERAYEKLSDTPEPFRYLLDSHFCWIQPLFNFVYRPAFTRDMKSGGPYFSQALMNAVLSHSVRWCRAEPGMQLLLSPYDGGSAFFEHAITDVLENVRHGHSKIPTVQALLLLSAQECGRGNRTQAWLYSGMAFRLIDDMGICVDGQRYADSGHFSAEDIEIRNRLFWSCYFWDKLICLYFGRSPMIQNSQISPPRVLMDDTAEIEPWTPHGLTSQNYPPKQAHSISCFIQMCALAEILNQILINLYSPSRDPSPTRAFQCASMEGGKMRDWWRDLPDHLKINLADPNLDCPPSHIVTLNCLYHTINILLHRAVLKLSREPEVTSGMVEHNPLIQCISSASSIIALFDLFCRTFGNGHVVLSLAYSLYTAASIFLIEVQAVGHAAPSTLERLTYCVGALSRLRTTNPVIATASDLISKELEALGISIPSEPPSGSDYQGNQSLGIQTFLPLPTDAYSTPAVSHVQSSGAMPQEQAPILLDASYLNSQLAGSMNYNILDMPPEMFEAFSQIEPISVTMNPGFDIY